MNGNIVKIKENTFKIYSYNTIVLGTGAAGFNAADRLHQFGQTDIAIVTEHINAGTSRNTGSDKQTYYKLTLSGDTSDSIAEMAENLFEGGCMDGDIALAEAALSTQSFFNLVEHGVPFPRNRYGEYVGYKTDHDPRTRATSVGPYTSKVMTESLEKSVLNKGIKIFNKMLCIRVLTHESKNYGILCLNLDSKNKEDRYVIFNCKNLVYATGGPAGMYSDSVYPPGHYGASGLAFQAGVKGRNLTEWQYGLASIRPRWNVSGTYMQVLPKFVSTSQDGNDSREFLFDYFEDENDVLSKVFMKGYQWPFDVRKIDNGSSIIDILVYIETYIKGRRVFLDFRQNPNNKDIDFKKLSSEAREYLENAGAKFGTPLDRLMHMNAPAVEFYKNKGVDLETDLLEIALCAQHNNGGLSIDSWWQTNIEGFYAVGEVAGSHGIYRPGGSALNAGQVGSLRAASYIAANGQGQAIDIDEFIKNVGQQVIDTVQLGENSISNEDNVDDIWKETTKQMSLAGAAIREEKAIRESASEVLRKINEFNSLVKISNTGKLRKVYRLYDVLISQYVYLSAMADYTKHNGRSRGSALYSDQTGKKPYDFLPDIFTYSLDIEANSTTIQEIIYDYNNNECNFNWRQVREIPEEDNFFETVWREYRNNENIY